MAPEGAACALIQLSTSKIENSNLLVFTVPILQVGLHSVVFHTPAHTREKLPELRR
eukprot:gene14427-4246_t